MSDQFAKGDEFKGCGVRQRLCIGGDALQRAEQDRQAGAFGLAVPVAFAVAAIAVTAVCFGIGGFRRIGAVDQSLALRGALARLSRRPVQTQLQRGCDPHGEEAAVEGVEIGEP
ncbi:MAG TPA: hypothetical protein VHX64_15930, partial [Caulobacteraceae bacterium]|nr:hypothetical protein [Caulobacteraceae bacterium]